MTTLPHKRLDRRSGLATTVAWNIASGHVLRNDNEAYMADDTEITVAERSIGNEATRFQPGNPGRPKGARNKLQEDFLKDVLTAWEAKGASAIDDMIADKPGEFVKMVAGLMPKEATLTINDHSEMTDDELAERVRSLAAQLAPFLIDGTGDAEKGTGRKTGAQIATRVH